MEKNSHKSETPGQSGPGEKPGLSGGTPAQGFNEQAKIEINHPVIKKIAALANELGYEVYAVGGFVRDYYLNRPGHDIDFTVVGDAISFAKEVGKRFKTKVVCYTRFRTAMAPIGKAHCEFVGARKEEYKPGSRKPEVYAGGLVDDLKRRDFTINAMAASINEENFGELIDLFGGLKDLSKRALRTPLEPETTYSDDPLRMLRAARFAAQLDFKIDKSSLAAIEKMADKISTISQERITDEFMKIIASDNPAKGLRILHETGLLKYVFPELSRMAGIETASDGSRAFGHKDVLLHSIKVLGNISRATDDIWLRFAALVHDIAKPVTKKFIKGQGWTFHGHEELGARYMKKIFRRMKLPFDKLEYVEKLVRLHQRPMALVGREVTDSAIRRLAVQAGDALEGLFTLCRADITTNNPRLSKKYLNNYEIVSKKVMEVQEKDRLREFQSPVRGDEIMEICGIKPSKLVGQIKYAIEEAILEGEIPNEYEPAKEYFIKNKDKWARQFSNDTDK